MVTKSNNLEPVEVEEPQVKHTPESENAMLHVREVAELLGVHPNTVRMWSDRGVLTSYRIGPRRDRRIPMAAVRLLLKSE